MSAIQIKNVPEDLHLKLRERARNEGRSISDYVRGLIETDLALPSAEEWFERLHGDPPVNTIGSEEIVRMIHAGRAERDEQILRALADNRD